MDGVSNITAEASAHSLMNWWGVAGVNDVVGDVSVNWLERDAKAEPNTENAPAAVKTATPTLVESSIAPLADWPKDIQGLQAAISAGSLLPGNMFGGKSVAPIGKTSAAVMVISDLPDRDELDAGQLGSGASGRLLTAMLAAIGIRLDEVYWTTLAATIPAIGELPNAALPPLAEFVRHQITLVQPKFCLLLGSSASKALLGSDIMTSRGSLQNINHDGSTKTVLTTFHPRTLIARPNMKEQAWKDLQMFAKRDDL